MEKNVQKIQPLLITRSPDNDVVLNVACIRDTPIPTPEFPTAALPAGFIVGFLGVVLFMRKSKEY